MQCIDGLHGIDITGLENQRRVWSHGQSYESDSWMSKVVVEHPAQSFGLGQARPNKSLQADVRRCPTLGKLSLVDEYADLIVRLQDGQILATG